MIDLGAPPTEHTPCDPSKAQDRELMSRGILETFLRAGWDEHQIAELGRILTIEAQLALAVRLRAPDRRVPRYPSTQENSHGQAAPRR